MSDATRYNIHRALRTFHCSLANDVKEVMGSRCPCCGNPMTASRSRRRNAASENRRDRASLAHNVAIGLGGNPEVWIWACRGCNMDQGHRSFAHWAKHLASTGDPRAERVDLLARVIKKWCADKGVSMMVEPIEVAAAVHKDNRWKVKACS